MNTAEIQSLVEELQQASQLYYQNMSSTPMTDEEYDAKIITLENLSTDPTNAHLFAEGTAAHMLIHGVAAGTEPKGETVRHAVPMLSLQKAKSERELESWVTRMTANGAKSFSLQAKLDGFALSAHYSNGHLQELITRGDGEVGELVTYLVNDPNVSIEGLPQLISTNEDLEVRGEIFLTDEQFEEANHARVESGQEAFKNSRNAVVGLMRRSKLGLTTPASFTFGTYSYIITGAPQNLSELPSGFLSVETLTRLQKPSLSLSGLEPGPELHGAVEAFGKARTGFSIPTDGVVIKPTNEAEMHVKMGSTGHHPVSQIAYKYPGEQGKSVIERFIITVGKTGKVTPTAVLSPVNVGGTTITRASCHNFRWCLDMNVRVGSVVMIHRANDVIPQVAFVVSNPTDSEELESPTTCPECGTELTWDGTEGWPARTLTCENRDCPSRAMHALNLAASRNGFDFDGMSSAIINGLINSGKLITVADFFKLTESDLAETVLGYTESGNPRQLGKARAKHILSHIEQAKEASLWRCLGALSVGSMGANTAKKLVKVFPTLEEVRNASVEQIADLDGFGLIRAQKIVSGLTYRSATIDEMLTAGVKFGSTTEASSESKAESSALQGLSFSISGEVPNPFNNRSEWVSYLEDNGAEFHGSPKASTSFMVADPSGSSSKIKKASSLGTQFLSAEEFTERFVS